MQYNQENPPQLHPGSEERQEELSEVEITTCDVSALFEELGTIRAQYGDQAYVARLAFIIEHSILEEGPLGEGQEIAEWLRVELCSHVPPLLDEIEPKEQARIFGAMAKIHLELGQFDEAKDYARQAAKITDIPLGLHIGHYRNLLNIYTRTGEVTIAHEIACGLSKLANEALHKGLRDEFCIAHIEMNDFYLALGERKEACDNLRAAVKLFEKEIDATGPGLLSLKIRLAEILLEYEAMEVLEHFQGDESEGLLVDVLEQLYGKNDNPIALVLEIDCYLTLANMHERRRDIETVVTSTEEAVTKAEMLYAFFENSSEGLALEDPFYRNRQAIVNAYYSHSYYLLEYGKILRESSEGEKYLQRALEHVKEGRRLAGAFFGEDSPWVAYFEHRLGLICVAEAEQDHSSLEHRLYAHEHFEIATQILNRGFDEPISFGQVYHDAAKNSYASQDIAEEAGIPNMIETEEKLEMAIELYNSAQEKPLRLLYEAYMLLSKISRDPLNKSECRRQARVIRSELET